jgi:cytochrome c5
MPRPQDPAYAVNMSPRWRSVWEGVFTPEQAARGRQAYDTYCSSCHRGDLGGANGRALVGNRFWQDWGEDTLASLSGITRQTMPRGAAGSLAEATYLDIVAYILERNGYPAGSDELSADRVQDVRVMRREGPGPVPNFALVTTVGLRRTGDTWTLSHSSEPVRTRNPDPSSGLEREAVESTALGRSTFELMDVYTSGEGHVGHKMEAKGLLIRGGQDRLNLTSLRMMGEECGP